MATAARSLALVTGASSGIGFELAKHCAENGFDLVVCADEPTIQIAAQTFRDLGAMVLAVQADLATTEGVDTVLAEVEASGQPLEMVLANAGRGLGGGFLDQDFNGVKLLLDTNILGTLYLLHKVATVMRARGRGRILITGSIAGFLPGAYQAVYNGTKAFLDSFSFALRNELKDSGVTVTCLMPGATETEFFQRADMLDTPVGQDDDKADPAEVARLGFEAMMKGDGEVIPGWQNKMRVAISRILPGDMAAELHRKAAEPRQTH